MSDDATGQGGGMSHLFDGTSPGPEEIDAIIEAGVASGDYEIVAEGPPRLYRLTEQGNRRAEEIFAGLGVTPEEAMAWLSEQMGDS